MNARDVVAKSFTQIQGLQMPQFAAANAIANLEAAGFRVVAPGELDQYTKKVVEEKYSKIIKALAEPSLWKRIFSNG